MGGLIGFGGTGDATATPLTTPRDPGLDPDALKSNDPWRGSSPFTLASAPPIWSHASSAPGDVVATTAS
ncbi:hypothetical protein Lfu02_04370 [Longispora fulva]|uniref:Uncharacterized protein n=1 Tax=Longispora fulva TaxID=619741 RepID=A0A8J7KJP9_9ACTN|nr:hypothetical protein [Longispora fulva]MBG6135696.1 hypothetical protein [Longispora fulva]GIG56065.1 hypothetical protein Lfu02_04370 [Longispora fulva]